MTDMRIIYSCSFVGFIVFAFLVPTFLEKSVQSRILMIMYNELEKASV